ncbi:hypothetical protein E2L06_18325 [Haloterrigena sp. H1]|uniref:hypothetical protein n=1 Tax=Haloterrigena sp. H1 TaxID=2552943 RepID=UPI00110F1911|nr:hypothetical protein [Haloterrigena sp. H1]TMT78032.1 hypothetical protein E2L06_20990 [Haloterrigena sp. H1]TMT80219.1 hypothetical protein E2L06_18325 [Haloterrigena sp. H1]
MSGSETSKTESEAERQDAVVFDESDPLGAVECLPPTVFPVTVSLELGRTTSSDKTHTQLSTPNYPVDVRVPQGPYIPESTVHFDNPAERPPRNTEPWSPAEFENALADLLSSLDEEDHVDTDRLYLTGLTVAELPPRFVTQDETTGQSVASPDLYTNEGEMTLGTFSRDGTLSAARVREDLDTAMPGQSHSPPQLVQITEVTAKPSRSSRQTQGSAGRRRYYTESEAERAGKVDAVPGVWKMDSIASYGESYRSLNGVLSSIDRFFPALSEEDVLQSLSFRGQRETRERFYAEEVIQR